MKKKIFLWYSDLYWAWWEFLWLRFLPPLEVSPLKATSKVLSERTNGAVAKWHSFADVQFVQCALNVFTSHITYELGRSATWFSSAVAYWSSVFSIVSLLNGLMSFFKCVFCTIFGSFSIFLQYDSLSTRFFHCYIFFFDLLGFGLAISSLE